MEVGLDMSLRGVKGGTLRWEEGRVAGGHEPRGEGALRGNRIGRLDRARALRRGGGGGSDPSDMDHSSLHPHNVIPLHRTACLSFQPVRR